MHCVAVLPVDTRYLVIAFACLWGAFEVFQQVRQRKKPRGEQDHDKGSLALIYLAITLGYSLGIPLAFSKYGRIVWGRPYVSLLGVAAIISGLVIRLTAMRTLGARFTYAVAVQRQHELVEDGIYRYVRHPGYLGQLMVFLGIGMAFANWLSLLGLLAPTFVAFSRRISVEESVLLKQFPARYRRYRERTWRLIPGVY
jgi:protein-S-isoprenylcysteine O-methyltransferase Ste14